MVTLCLLWGLCVDPVKFLLSPRARDRELAQHRSGGFQHVSEALHLDGLGHQAV
jgi:hypothetical protein